MTGQYSIRNGLSLIAVPGSPNTLSADAFTMGEMFHGVGYATAIFGKWHLGGDPQSPPTAHGFDEFYGIPPNISWDSATYVDTSPSRTRSRLRMRRCSRRARTSSRRRPAGRCHRSSHSRPKCAPTSTMSWQPSRSTSCSGRRPPACRSFSTCRSRWDTFRICHPSIRRQVAHRELRRQVDGGRFPRRPQILDTLKGLGVDDDTIVVFASDNGPKGSEYREFGNQGTPDMGSRGPFAANWAKRPRGRSARPRSSAGPARQAGHHLVRDVLDHGLPADVRHIVGGKMPTDRPIDGIDQTDVLLGNSAVGQRASLLSFIGPDLVAARWKQWRIYFTDMHPTGVGSQRLTGTIPATAPMAGYPKVYNIEMDPHEDLNVAGLFAWVGDPALEVVRRYEKSVKTYPNPPAEHHGVRQGRLIGDESGWRPDAGGFGDRGDLATASESGGGRLWLLATGILWQPGACPARPAGRFATFNS